MSKNSQFDKTTPIAMVTAYDAPVARCAEQSNMDIVLVGDSVGPNILGYESVHDVTVADICHHTSAARRGAPNTHIMADLPWESISSNSSEDVLAAAKAIINAGADSVKLEIEDGRISLLETLIANDISVCAHVGYTPQSPELSVTVQGKEFNRAREIVELAEIAESKGAFMLLMELIPAELAKMITDSVSIPTIGIGAGVHCTGQVQVFCDITGYSDRIYRHAKLFADSASVMRDAFTQYRDGVHDHSFPTMKNCSSMPEETLQKLTEWRS